MISFLCFLWPYLVGGLIGWLLCGWWALSCRGGNVQSHAPAAVMGDAGGRVKMLEQELAQSKKELQLLRDGPPFDLVAAREAGFMDVKGVDDLEVVEGIGPKIAELLKAQGVHRFSELARASQSQLQGILIQAGPTFRMAKPDTWPEQAELAMRNRWRALKVLQDELNGGIRNPIAKDPTP